MSLKSSGPGEDGGQDDAAAVGQGVLVVAGGQGAPLLEHVEAAFDDVPAGVLDRVVVDGAATPGASTFAVAGLVVRLRDDGLDAAAAQVAASAARRVRLVGADQHW